MRSRSQTAYARNLETEPTEEAEDELEQNVSTDHSGVPTESTPADTFQTIAERVSAVGRQAITKGTSLAKSGLQKSDMVAARLEAFTRRRPFSALAGALFAGIVLGLLKSRRS